MDSVAGLQSEYDIIFHLFSDIAQLFLRWLNRYPSIGPVQATEAEGVISAPENSSPSSARRSWIRRVIAVGVIHVEKSASDISRRLRGVSMMVGQMAFILMSYWLFSFAVLLSRAFKALLLAL